MFSYLSTASVPPYGTANPTREESHNDAMSEDIKLRLGFLDPLVDLLGQLREVATQIFGKGGIGFDETTMQAASCRR